MSKTHYHICGEFAKSEDCNCNDILQDSNLSSNDVIYNSPNLVCTDIEALNTLTIVLQKLETKICELRQSLSPTTSTTII